MVASFLINDQETLWRRERDIASDEESVRCAAAWRWMICRSVSEAVFSELCKRLSAPLFKETCSFVLVGFRGDWGISFPSSLRKPASHRGSKKHEKEVTRRGREDVF